MEFRILGPVQVWHMGAELAVGRPRHRAVLAVLLAHAGEVVSVDRLVWALWGESPPSNAVAMLHVRVSQLRKSMAAAQVDPHTVVVTQRGGYVLAPGPEQLDADRFERLVFTGRRALGRGDHHVAAAVLSEGLGLWRGRPFGAFADEPFAQAQSARLERLRLDTLEARIEADILVGRHGDVVTELEGLTAEHHLRERFWAQLMLALYRSGRQGEALQTYRAARTRLTDLLGVDPGPELSRLQEAILHQDVGLASWGPYRVRRSRLPETLTSFVGREPELAELAGRIRHERLVTLTGPGAGSTGGTGANAPRRRLPGHHPGRFGSRDRRRRAGPCRLRRAGRYHRNHRRPGRRRPGSGVANDHDRAEAALSQALRNARVLDNVGLEQWSLLCVVLSELSRGAHDQSARLTERSAPIGNTNALAWWEAMRAATEFHCGELNGAVESLRRSLRLFHDLDAGWGLSFGLLIAGQVTAQNGEQGLSSTLLGACETLRESVGAGLWPVAQGWASDLVRRGERALGGEAFSEMRLAGGALSVDEVVDVALQGLDAINGRSGGLRVVAS